MSELYLETNKYANHMQIMFKNINEVDVKKWISHRSKKNKIHMQGWVNKGLEYISALVCFFPYILACLFVCLFFFLFKIVVHDLSAEDTMDSHDG